jgi:hypothetical protein
MDKYIGEKIRIPFRKEELEVKEIIDIDKKKPLAILNDGTIVSLDILKTKEGKYLTEIK